MSPGSLLREPARDVARWMQYAAELRDYQAYKTAPTPETEP